MLEAAVVIVGAALVMGKRMGKQKMIEANF
jgi:hypothetical protein